ncbi:hypothetical protein Sango_2618000 [Sesamum angolense]|uniref:PPPDE domain-containing protein n=1 Tax=Sesamum angolense TaxID=2727404 RepID=A0AAE1W1G4_9LAMI|nr:hypothetical protein Sango_2618000 [Sesamum angolense]
MREVILHVYDVTNSGYDKTNNTIMQINKIFKDGIGLGGIFHTYSVHGVVKDYLLQFRTLVLIDLQSLFPLSCTTYVFDVYGDEEWSFGFCEQGTGVFSCPSTQNPMYTYRESINLGKTSFYLQGWVNRFANAGDTAVEIAGNTAYRFRQAKTEIVSASRVAYRFLAGVASNNSNVAPDSPGNSNSGSPRFQATWLKNLVSPGTKPSTGSKVENQDQDG